MKLRGALIGLMTCAGSLQAQSLKVTASNPLAVERRDEVIGVAWSDVTRALKSAASNRVRVTDGGNRELLSQVIDNEGDGKPDELLFLADFWPKEEKSFTVLAEPATMKAERTR